MHVVQKRNEESRKLRRIWSSIPMLECSKWFASKICPTRFQCFRFSLVQLSSLSFHCQTFCTRSNPLAITHISYFDFCHFFSRLFFCRLSSFKSKILCQKLSRDDSMLNEADQRQQTMLVCDIRNQTQSAQKNKK